MDEWFLMRKSYPTHPKTLRLIKLIGPRADAFPPRIWAWCSEHFRDGRPDVEVLEAATGWDGEAGALVSALKEARFLDADGAIHDWMDHTGKMLAKMDEKRKADRKRIAEGADKSQRKKKKSQRVRSDVDANSGVKTKTKTKNSTPKGVVENGLSAGDDVAPPPDPAPPKKDGRMQLTEEQSEFFRGFEAHIERLSPSTAARAEPEVSDVVAIREISKDRWALPLVAKAIEWCATSDYWRENVMTLRGVANQLKRLVPAYESSLNAPKKLQSGGSSGLDPGTEAAIRDMSFPEWQGAVGRTYSGLSRSEWPDDTKDQREDKQLEARRQTAKRFRIALDPPPSCNDPGSLPWRKWSKG